MSIINIDFHLDNILRSYKEGDNIFYSFGLDNNILGLLNISEIEDINNIYKDLEEKLPIGIYINGVIAVYNENTFEDFDSILNEHIVKIKEINKNKNINYFQGLLKELLYVDDEDELNFEIKKYNDDEDIQINFIKNLIDLLFKDNDANYSFICYKLNIILSSNNIPENCENIEELTKEDIQNVFNDLENNEIKVLNKNFDFSNYLCQDYNSSNFNINKLPYKNIIIGYKDKFIENILFNDFEFKQHLKTNFCLETLGIISKNNFDKNIFKKMLIKMNNYLKNLFSLENNKNIITTNNILYNNLFNSLPFLIKCKTNLNENNLKSEIIDVNNLKKLYNIHGISLFDFTPEIMSEEKEENKLQSEHLLNPHLSIPDITKQNENTNIIRDFVKGDYQYYHYNQDNCSDVGWGCAYRSLQALCSWFILNTSVGKNKKVPSITEIQKILVKLGDKESKIIGSTTWIGAVEVNLVLNEIFGIDNKIQFVASGKEMDSQGREILYHFKHNKAPIMIGGGIFAYTILGIDYDKIKGQCKFIIMDPHYAGSDDIKTIINKGWCNWKDISLFDKNSFYNMCMPAIY